MKGHAIRTTCGKSQERWDAPIRFAFAHAEHHL
jgi:hypothetical protein